MSRNTAIDYFLNVGTMGEGGEDMDPQRFFNTIDVGPFKLVPGLNSVLLPKKDGTTVTLRFRAARSYEFLHIVAQYAGEPVSALQLYQALWENRPVPRNYRLNVWNVFMRTHERMEHACPGSGPFIIRSWGQYRLRLTA